MRVLIDFNCERVGEGLSSSFFWVPETEVVTWISKEKPVMDMFDETKPDILILSAEKLDMPELQIARSRYPNTKIVSVGEVGGNVLSPDLSIGHTGKPMPFPCIPFFGGAMVGMIGSPVKEKYLGCDILCITDYIDVSNSDSIAYLDFVCENYNTKIFGQKKVPFPNYLGILSPAQRSSALASASIYLDLDGHSWYDGAWLGMEVISVSDSSINFFNNIKDLEEKINFCLSRNGSAKQSIKASVMNSTYFDLTSDILNFFGLQSQGNFLQQKKKELV
jgi:hypothetical protein